jgi:hypothetical protein
MQLSASLVIIIATEHCFTSDDSLSLWCNAVGMEYMKVLTKVCISIKITNIILRHYKCNEGRLQTFCQQDYESFQILMAVWQYLVRRIFRASPSDNVWVIEHL